MEQITSLREMYCELKEEKKQLRLKIRECRDALAKCERDLRYYEGAEDSVDIMMKRICENAIGNGTAEEIMQTENTEQTEELGETPAQKTTNSRSRSSGRGKR